MIVAPWPTQSASIKIILLEDNFISRQLISDYLLTCGYEVLGLAEAKYFTCALEHFKPDVILLDLKLPEIDGYTVLQQMQEKREWQKIPVIVVSAFAFQADQQRAFELGARRYLVKPIKLLDLIQAIEEETRH